MTTAVSILLQTFLVLSFRYVTRCDSADYLRDVENSWNEDNEVEALNLMIKHCGEEYSYKQLRLIKQNANLYSKLFENIHQDLWISVEVFDHVNQLSTADWQTCVILFLSDEEEVNKFRKSAASEYSWKPGNLYVIHMTSSKTGDTDKSDEKTSAEIWKKPAVQLWRKYTVHKFVVSINGRNFFFDPFARSVSPESGINVDPNGKNAFGVIRSLGESSELLKSRKTFNGYEVNVAVFPYVTMEKTNNVWSGMDANFMTEICRELNVTPSIFEPPDQFGWSSNGKFFGTLGRLVYRESDLALNGFFVKYYETDELEFSSSVIMDEICVIVPQRDRVPEYLLIARIFSLPSWTLIFFANIFLTLTYLLLTSVDFDSLRKFSSAQRPDEQQMLRKNLFRNFSGRNRTLTRVRRFLASWIFLSFYPIKPRQKLLLSQRLHVAVGLMLGIVIGGCFTSKLASSLSRPGFLKNIDTLKELDESGLEILTSFPDLLDDVFADNESATFRNLGIKLELKTPSEIIEQVFRKRNAGYLNRKHTVILAGQSDHELHVVTECPKEYHLAFPILKGSPFLPRMNTIIGRLQNGGMSTKWFNEMKKPWKDDESKDPVVIRLPHLYMPFFMLFTGLAIACGTFCCELKDRPSKAVKKRKITLQGMQVSIMRNNRNF